MRAVKEIGKVLLVAISVGTVLAILLHFSLALAIFHPIYNGILLTSLIVFLQYLNK